LNIFIEDSSGKRESYFLPTSGEKNIAKMPLLRRLPFVSQPPPLDLNPDEQVFYLKMTNEIFRDYEYVPKQVT